MEITCVIINLEYCAEDKFRAWNKSLRLKAGMINMSNLTAVVLGYGMRGQVYASYSANVPGSFEIKAIAEPIKARQETAKKLHNLSDDMIFNDWKEIAALPKMADFAIIATQDDMHIEPALACIEKGYNLLLEKPMAPTAKECKMISEAAEKKGVKVIVCHVLRFTDFYCTVKDMIDSGKIGNIMSINAEECVGNEHQSHSFVRGNWRNSKESSPMILAKSCHDTDILQWLVGKKCTKVQSFGSLSFFNKDNRPDGAPDYCVQGCPVADECPYNAIKLYYDDKDNCWFRSAAAKTLDNPTDEQVMKAITDGPYGRCVFACDNDVVDHQVVNMEFEGGATISFSMNAFNQGGRRLRVFGTKGLIDGNIDSGIIDVYTFLDKKTETINLNNVGNSIVDGHGGGDTGIMIDLLKYFGEGETTKSVCGITTSYLNHLISFAAEESRLTGKVIDMDEFEKSI